MPDLAKVVPIFNVESLDNNAEDRLLDSHSRRKVEFESLEFNKRFIATAPSYHDPIALRELFSPAFLDWTRASTARSSSGSPTASSSSSGSARAQRGGAQGGAAGARGIFEKLQREMDEDGLHTTSPALGTPG